MLLLPPRRTWLKGARERMRVQAGRIFFQNQRRWWTGNERRMRISHFYSERGDTRHLRSGDPFTTFEGGVLNASRYKTSALDHTRLSRGSLNYEPGFSERKKFFFLIILAFGAQNITKEPHWHSPAQLPSPSFSDRVHRVTNAAAYCLVYILPLGFSNHYTPLMRRVWLAPSHPRPFFTLLANSGNFLDISFILRCVLHVGCNNISNWSILRKIRLLVNPTQTISVEKTITCLRNS